MSNDIFGLKSKFDSLQALFGSFSMIKVFPESIDTNSLSSKVYVLKFDNYCHKDSVTQYLNTIEEIQYCACILTNDIPLGSNNVEPGLAKGDLQFTPEGQLIKSKLYGTPSYHKNSFQWNLYKMKVVPAWEITEGKNDIVLNVHESETNKEDIFLTRAIQDLDAWKATFKDWENKHGVGLGYEQEATTDYRTGDYYMKIRQTDRFDQSSIWPNTISGNMIFNISQVKTPGTYWKQDIGAGQGIVDVNRSTHGNKILASMIAKKNDKGIVGICPECSGIIGLKKTKINIKDLNNDGDFDDEGEHYYYGSFPNLIDIDPVVPEIQTANTASFSSMEVSLDELKKSSINGMIAITGTQMTNTFLHNNKQVKIFGVGIYKEGKSYSKWKDQRRLVEYNDMFGKYYKLEPYEYISDYVKWDPRISLDNYYDSNKKKHWSRKFIDGEPVFGINNIEFDDDFIWRESNGKYIIKSGVIDFVMPHVALTLENHTTNGGYIVPGFANSQSVGFLNGVCGLMLSVDKTLGVDLNQNQDAVNDLVDIHIKAYDI